MQPCKSPSTKKIDEIQLGNLEQVLFCFHQLICILLGTMWGKQVSQKNQFMEVTSTCQPLCFTELEKSFNNWIQSIHPYFWVFTEAVNYHVLFTKTCWAVLGTLYLGSFHYPSKLGRKLVTNNSPCPQPFDLTWVGVKAWIGIFIFSLGWDWDPMRYVNVDIMVLLW